MVGEIVRRQTQRARPCALVAGSLWLVHVAAVQRVLKTSATHPLEVDFLPAEEVGLGGRIGICGAPGRQDQAAEDGPWMRDLETDLQRLRDDFEVNYLVTLLERGAFVRDELAEFNIRDILFRAKRVKMHAEWCAMPDGGVPLSLDQLIGLVERILEAAARGDNTVIHCSDGRGRSALVAGCCLNALGASADEALRIVRTLRPGSVATAAQIQCMHAFDQLWRKRMLEQSRHADMSELFTFAEGNVVGGFTKISQTGLAPLSYAGAATLSYVGLTRWGVSSAAPLPEALHEGDLFHVMPGEVLFIGSERGCDVRIASPNVDPVHAAAIFAPAAEGHLLIADFGSRSGTWVAGSNAAISFLNTGDEFEAARCYAFRFESVG